MVSMERIGCLSTISAIVLSLARGQKKSGDFPIKVQISKSQALLLPEVVDGNFYPVDLFFERLHQQAVVFVLVEVPLRGDLEIRPNIFSNLFHHCFSFCANFFLLAKKFPKYYLEGECGQNEIC